MVFGRTRQRPLGPGDAPVGKKEKYFDICSELYIIQGKSLAEIARTDDDYPSERTLSDWRDAGEWDKKRREYLQKNQGFKAILEQLKLKLAREAYEANPTNPQLVYALAALLKIEPERRSSDAAAKDKDSPKEISEETLKKVKEEIYGIIESND